MEVDTRLLRTFRAVAETRSFTGAAKKLRLTQSSVSQQIGALERELGAHLLKRSKKFVGLTTAGEIFLQCARQVLDNLDRVRGMLVEHSQTATGHLSIGAPALFCHTLLPEVIGVFHARYPGVALSVFTADPDSMAARLAHHEFDLALPPFPVKQQSLGLVQQATTSWSRSLRPGIRNCVRCGRKVRPEENWVKFHLWASNAVFDWGCFVALLKSHGPEATEFCAKDATAAPTLSGRMRPPVLTTT